MSLELLNETVQRAVSLGAQQVKGMLHRSTHVELQQREQGAQTLFALLQALQQIGETDADAVLLRMLACLVDDGMALIQQHQHLT